MMVKHLREKMFWVAGDWSDDDSIIKPYEEWAEENCKGEYTIQKKWDKDPVWKFDKKEEMIEVKPQFLGCAITFENEEDIVAFKLRWM